MNVYIVVAKVYQDEYMKDYESAAPYKRILYVYSDRSKAEEKIHELEIDDYYAQTSIGCDPTHFEIVERDVL